MQTHSLVSHLHCSVFRAHARIVGVYSIGGPPVPIPNTEVKPECAENTCLETDREDRSAPTSRERKSFRLPLFCYIRRSVAVSDVKRRIAVLGFKMRRQCGDKSWGSGGIPRWRFVREALTGFFKSGMYSRNASGRHDPRLRCAGVLKRTGLRGEKCIVIITGCPIDRQPVIFCYVQFMRIETSKMLFSAEVSMLPSWRLTHSRTFFRP